MTGYERFEEIARLYLNANEEQRKAALSLIPEAERKTFLEGVGLYHLITDEVFFRATREAMGKTIYKELRKG